MDDNAKRIQINNQIVALVAARDAAGTTDAQKAVLATQIQAAERLIDLIDIGAADQIGAKIDSILAKLEAVETANPLDAVSALGRAIKGLKDFRAEI